MLNKDLTRLNAGEWWQTLLEYALLLTLIGATSVLMLTAAGINVGRLLTALSLPSQTAAQIDRPFGQ